MSKCLNGYISCFIKRLKMGLSGCLCLTCCWVLLLTLSQKPKLFYIYLRICLDQCNNTAKIAHLHMWKADKHTKIAITWQIDPILDTDISFILRGADNIWRLGPFPFFSPENKNVHILKSIDLWKYYYCNSVEGPHTAPERHRMKCNANGAQVVPKGWRHERS